MKRKLLSVLFVIAAFGFINPNTASAQVRVGVNINIGDQPQWGPVGYDYAEYYYLPDIEAYYYVPRHQFVYMSGNRWIFSSSLPGRYSNYDLYSGYKVVLGRHDDYRNFNTHRMRYAGYRNYGSRQETIMSRHDNGRHNGWYKNKDRGHGRGHGRGRD